MYHRSLMKGRRLDWLIYTLVTVIAFRYKMKVLDAGVKAFQQQRAQAARALRNAAAAAGSEVPPPLVDPEGEDAEAAASLSSDAAAAAAVDAKIAAAADAAAAAPPRPSAGAAAAKGPRTPAAARAALDSAWDGARAAVEKARAAGPAQFVAACCTVAGYIKTAIAAVSHGAGKAAAPAPFERGAVHVPASAKPMSLKRVGPPSGGAVRKKMAAAERLKGEKRPVHASFGCTYCPCFRCALSCM